MSIKLLTYFVLILYLHESKEQGALNLSSAIIQAKIIIVPKYGKPQSLSVNPTVSKFSQ
jgi:hypothetical protein